MQRSKCPAQKSERSSSALLREGGDRGEAGAVGAHVNLFAEEEIAIDGIGLAAFEAAVGQHLAGRHVTAPP